MSNHPRDVLRYHVSGAVERGEKEPIVEQPETTVIACSCILCKGLRARIRGDGAGMTPTKVHNLVRIAHSPLAKAQSTQRFGPWAI